MGKRYCHMPRGGWGLHVRQQPFRFIFVIWSFIFVLLESSITASFPFFYLTASVQHITLLFLVFKQTKGLSQFIPVHTVVLVEREVDRERCRHNRQRPLSIVLLRLHLSRPPYRHFNPSPLFCCIQDLPLSVLVAVLPLVVLGVRVSPRPSVAEMEIRREKRVTGMIF